MLRYFHGLSVSIVSVSLMAGPLLAQEAQDPSCARSRSRMYPDRALGASSQELLDSFDARVAGARGS